MPTGNRLTMACSRMEGSKWGQEMKEKLEEVMSKVSVNGGYVDDMRFLISLIMLGYEWDSNKKEVFWSQEVKDKEVREVWKELKVD